MPIGIGIGICEDYADIRKKNYPSFNIVKNNIRDVW